MDFESGLTRRELTLPRDDPATDCKYILSLYHYPPMPWSNRSTDGVLIKVIHPNIYSQFRIKRLHLYNNYWYADK